MTTSGAPKSDWRVTLLNRLADSPPKLDPLGQKLASLTGANRRLFHYTNATGLQGIVEGGCIWATAASYLNDASEIEYGCTILEEVFEKWEKANNDPDSFSAAVVRTLRKVFNDPHSKTKRATTIYVACFCGKNNLLSQWRAYGQAGGYSIGFSLAGKGLQTIGGGRLRGVKPESDAYRATLARVIYQKEAQFAALEEGLARHLRALDHPEIYATLEKLDSKEGKDFFGTAVILIELFLMEQIVAFKNKAFEEEQEWRIVVQPISGQGLWLDGKKDEAVYLRSARGLIIPYVKIISAEGKLPIESVTIGPSLDKIRAERSVKLLLVQKDHAGVEIDGSDIPVVL